ncbi:UDP-N-acetylmuramoyl-tripeptide--D-alanyl-D-alanine ligase [Paenibacillus thermotolerans]|uniref:UDP-N-acetylmuramoyl-tripeptide--D-alanyl-D- alanine ligase n=1 Tax=Paenibacillus thermotolerans TaxID=3027807 RepID=UPI0023679EBB|nr:MULTISPECIES: UDP-N-acetylmuramoyl-tripeptide--D-alanyl-D-alanine ligase [unclassified Paenibacillus]
MIKADIQQIVQWTGGKLSAGNETAAETKIAGVSTDTRSIVTGNLFVPLIGEKFNGHTYVTEAVGLGASAVLWQDNQGEPPESVTAVIVDDSLKAYQRLAAAYRSTLPLTIVGITGSNGKTTTKDMTAAVLGMKYKVHKTQGNLNNHIGLPRTLLALEPDTEVAVLEMGMSGFGEIELLAGIANPDAVVITNIGEAHLLQLGSRDGIAKAKLEILSGLKEGGLFVSPGDEPLIDRYEGDANKPSAYRKLRFGEGGGNDLVLREVRIGEAQTEFRTHDSSVAFTIPLLGKHNAMNALAAILIGRSFGIPDETIAEGLRAMTPTGMRIERLEGVNGITLLNDAYNASPASMKAALELLAAAKSYRRKFAVLGDMLELGEQEKELHRDIGRFIDPHTADYVFTYGELGKQIAHEASKRFDSGYVEAFDSKEDIVRKIEQTAGPGDVVLVKASRGMRLEDIVNSLRKEK